MSMMSIGNPALSAIVIHYQTPDLLDTAVRSLKRFYPELHTLVVDNGSRDDSRRVIEGLARELGPSVEPLFLDRNLFHGPAMDLAIRRCRADAVYVFDSDTETLRGGFLEEMTEALFSADDLYGVGRVATVDRRGFPAPSGIPILVSAYMMLRREPYGQLPPFEHHGMPTLRNFRAAAERGYRFRHYPVDQAVLHLGRGTASRFGYGLGLRSRLDYLLNRLGL